LRLLVIRHARAEEQDARRWPDDSLRPLSQKGEKDFRTSARGLSRLVTPDAVHASPYLRTMQTAQVLAKVAGWPAPETSSDLAMGDVPGFISGLVQRHPEATVAIVGHNPSLPMLVSRLSAGHAEALLQFKPGAAALLDVEELPAGELRGTLRWLAQPRLTRQLGR
jgi:phosphohistidine phosphatase